MEQKHSLDFDEFPLVSASGWEFKVRSELKGGDFAARMHSETWDQLSLRSLYHRDDLAACGRLPHCAPGEPPFIRGAARQPGGCATWLDISTSDVVEANRIARTALEHGVVTLCFYARINDQRIRGVAISQQSDMAKLVAGIDLAKTDIFFDWGLHAPAIIALLLNEARRQGLDPKSIRGGLLFDPIAEMLPAGSYCGRPENLYKRLFRLYSAIGRDFAPQFHPLTIKGHPYHNAGASGVQEIAYAMSAAVAYIDGLTELGVPLQQVLGDIRFSFAQGPHFIPEIAKFRAARLVWASIAKAYATQDAEPPTSCHIHGRSSRVNQETLAPKWNIPRSTLAALAAMSGGCDAVSIIPFDEAAGEPDAGAYAVSCAIAEILQNEARLANMLDPFGGAYAVEALTVTMAQQALALFQRTEQAGGLIAAIASGQLQREIGNIRQFKEKQLACGQELFVGLNTLPVASAGQPHPAKRETPLLASSDEKERLMIDPYAVEQLQYAFNEGVGLADVTGLAYRSEESFTFEPLRPFRAAAPFEKMRSASAEAARERTKPIKALLIFEEESPLCLARCQLVRQALAIFGFRLDELCLSPEISDEEMYQQASEVDIVVLSATDERYPMLARRVFCELNRTHPSILKMVAGYPLGCLDTLRSFGTDDFIHAKTHLVEFYQRHARRLGVHP